MRKRTAAFLLLLSLMLSACDAISSPTPIDPIDPLRTAAAATVMAMTTQVMQTQQALMNPMRTSTSPVLTLPPVATAIPSASQPTPEAPAQNTATPSKNCDLAEFVDETIPDGSKFPPGTQVVKTWTLKNVGTCSWTEKYDAVFVEGDAMQGPASQPLTSIPIHPGEEVVIQMTFVTPETVGRYRAEFKLRNAYGVLFGFNNPEATYWVDVEVSG